MLNLAAAVLCTCVALVAGVSKDIEEDARLDVPGLIKKYGYPFEGHDVLTPDGYVLAVHRIPYGRDANIEGDRPVAYLMHGLLSSSIDFVATGPQKALGYLLADQGYDVWMGNARGNHYSRRNLFLDPDSTDNKDFWNFSWDEIGNIDLPTTIDYILAMTGKSKLHYVGFSQGTTVFFVMGSLQPEYSDKIISMQAMAPVSYMDNTKSKFFQIFSPLANPLKRVVLLIGTGELLPNSHILNWTDQAVCMKHAVIKAVCKNILFLIVGWNEGPFNKTLLPVILAHVPAGSSVRQVTHYGQNINSKQFQRYDHGWARNMFLYGSFSPPKYPLSEITAPIFLHYAVADQVTAVKDVDRLYRELRAPVVRYKVKNESFGHLDFGFGDEAKTTVYDRLIKDMQALDEN